MSDPRHDQVVRPEPDAEMRASAARVADGFERYAAASDDPLRVAQRRFAAAMRTATEAAAGAASNLDDLATATELAEALTAALGTGAPTRQYGDSMPGLGGPGPAFLDWSPICGPSNPAAPPLQLSIDAERASVVGTATFGTAYEGPPGLVHGGWIAAGFDEVLGVTQSVFADPGMTVRLDVRYRAPTPLWEPVTFEGWVVEVRGRRRTLGGQLVARGQVTATAEGTFIGVAMERFQDMVDRRQSGGQQGLRRPED